MKKIVLLIVLTMTISTADNLMTPKFDCQDDEVQVCTMGACSMTLVNCPIETVCNKNGVCWTEGGNCNTTTCEQNCYCRKKK